MDFIDYYKILDIAKTATEAEIKTAYRKMARKNHPDLNPNDENAKKRFQQINEANEVLSDKEKRKKYDEFGKDWKHADEIKANRNQQQSQSNNRSQNNSGGFGGFEGNFSDGDFSDFFESMYGSGGGKGRQTKYRGQDINAELKLNLIDVYTTQKQTLTINGKQIRLTIPAGVDNGQVIKIAGHGSPGANGGPNGDLYITFSIINTTKFKRESSNLYLNVDVDLYTAILGGEITIDTLTTKVKLKVAPDTQSGFKVKLKGKGFAVYKKDNEFGDLYITYVVKLPTNLSEKEKELFNELSKLRNHGN